MALHDNEGDEDRDQDDPRNRQVQTTPENVEVEQEEAHAQAEPEVEVIEASGEEENEQGGDERIAQSDEDQEQHSRRRETAAERRQRAKEAKLRDKRELDFQKRELDRLQRTVWDLTQGQVVTRLTELDNRISSAQAEVAQWDKVKAAAITKQNGADAVAADNLRVEAQNKLNQALWDKNNIVQAEQQRTAQAQQPRQAPVALEGYKQKFYDANPWYHQDGLDEDSLIVKAIDHAVAQLYAPTDPSYWKELQKRIDKRFGKQQSRNDDSDEDDVDDDQQEERTQRNTQRRGPPTGGSSRNNSSGGGGNTQQIRLSPERVQAMKDANLWDDPKTRAKMAKKYAEYDRSNRG